MPGFSFARWRKRAGLTLQQVADALGVTKGAVGHWETGRHAIAPITLALLRRVAAENGWPLP